MTEDAIAPERVKFWHEQRYANLELLHAHYVTHTFSRHAHDTFAVGVILQGAEAFSYRGAQQIAPAGHVVVINPGEAHTGSAATRAGWTYRMLYPSRDLLQQAAAEVGRKPTAEPWFTDAVIQDDALWRSLLSLHLALERPPSRLEQDSRLVWTLAQLVRRHAAAHAPAPLLKPETAAIQRVRDYLHEHMADNPSLKTLAAIAHLSPYYLLRQFQRQVGASPHEYVRGLRLTRAKALLLNGWAIADVAHHTGFADQSHFTRQFKRAVGVTPGCYQHGALSLR
ncbi:MAG: AraC family transcriptional regulator [Kaiparowitsia implicata GSE-PSE-MK54-09C]|jgi:AraC-like DNA-binding protein|nr:AraC family transcriptional regulator [Kaiparowitsia implicata GSE-PSE-MK54-09C]